ncbi:MAG: TIM-barrel domain-containing protein, partial [Chloroflexota bacterium]
MASTARALGHFQSFTKHGHRAVAAATRGVIEIAPSPLGGLRVRIGRKKRLPEYQSLVVTNVGATSESPRSEAKRGWSPLRCTPSKSGAVIRAPVLTAHLQFDPVSLSFPQPKRPPFAVDLSIGFRGDYIVVRKKINPSDHIYGLGEKTGWLDKRHRKYKMRNADVWHEHPAGLGNVTDPLYASFPFLIIHNRRHTYGIFVDNTGFTEFNLTGDDWLEFSAPTDVLNYYVFPGPTLADVVRQYTDLTGRMPLPALWTLGYQQCRWGYASEGDVRRIASELRKRRIPADGLWMDIDYMDGYRVFTWDKRGFPRPKQMMDDLRRDGFHAVTIVDPGVKVDDGYFMYDEGRTGDHFVKHSDGREYNGSVWPGPSAFPDFHGAATREWWAGHVRRWLADSGPSGLWIDMNEPASRDITGSIMDTWHDGGRLPHAAARNTYALQMARATFDGMMTHDPDSRPFILTRAAFSGVQTVAALWGGDNSSQW